MKPTAPTSLISPGGRASLDRRGFLSLGLKALAAGALSGLLPRPRNARADSWVPNIIYVVMDTTRGDHMSFLGYGRATTPNLARLAAQASVFSRAISPSNWTLPSFASLLCGKTPLNHDLNSPLDNTRLRGTLATTLSNQGYRTVSIQTNGMVRRLDEDFHEGYHLEYEDAKTIDAIAVGQALGWLGDGGMDGLFFMFLGLYGPHQKYYPHDSFAGYLGDAIFNGAPLNTILASPLPVPEDLLLRAEDMPSRALNMLGRPKSQSFYQDTRIYQAAYDSEITFTDAQLGFLLDHLRDKGLFDSSLIIVTADHGEVMDQGTLFFSHGQDFIQGQIQVPLIIKLPFQSQGQVFTNWVSTMDIAPTILDYLGLDRSGQEGVSLLPLIKGETGDLIRDDITSYANVYRMTDLEGATMLVRRMLTLIKNGYKFTKTMHNMASDFGPVSYALYNLEADPRELNELSAREGEMLAQFKEYMAARYPQFQ